MLFANENDDVFHEILVGGVLVVEPGDELRYDFDESFLGDVDVVDLELIDEFGRVVAHGDEVEDFEAIL